MLNLLIGEDWVANQEAIMSLIAKDVSDKKQNRVLMVPELISHSAERKLCEVAGDTASRYAEVLSFTRLARRVAEASGHAVWDCMDDGGRVVAMAAAVQSVQSKLKAYASVGTKPEFLSGMVDAVDEFKRCCIRPADLHYASEQAEGSLAQKLEELSLILEGYEAVCENGKKDPRDQMVLLLQELQDGSYGQDHVFYIDGFPDFTLQNMAIIQHLIEVSQNVTISLCCDAVDSAKLAFEKAGATAGELVRIAKKLGVSVKITVIPARNTKMQTVCHNLFQGPIEENCSCVSVFRTESVHQECIQLVKKIQKLVQSGVRYREIGVVCANLSVYKNMLHSIFQRCSIPVYLTGTDSILEKPVITTVLAAIDTAMDGFEQGDVLRYLKTPFSPLAEELCDHVENYVIKWGITGKQWLDDWKNHPFALDGKWDQKATDLLRELNDARRVAIQPLVRLRENLHKANNIAGQVEAIYRFFEEISLADKLYEMACAADVDDNRTAQVLDQIWEILVGALEQIHDVVGVCVWKPDVFSRLFRLLLSQYSVGTIPAVLDSVMVGTVTTMRCQQVKHLFVLGALEGAFPSFGGVSGILTDSERSVLRLLGLPLTGGSLDGLQIEFSEIHGTFCGTNESVTLSCPAGQPSYLYQRLMKIAGFEEADSAESCLASAADASAYLVRMDRQDLAEELGLKDAVSAVSSKRDHTLGVIAEELIEKLYGKKLYLSASRVDMQSKCRFSYLLRYGLKLEERKQITIDPAEFGTYVHDVLENTVADVMELGGFREVSLEKMLEIAKKYSDEYAKSHFSELETQRVNYLFNRNSQELERVIVELWDELRQSKFEPRFMELGFGVGEGMPPIEIKGNSKDGQLVGFVDRVDLWENNDQTYFRVVDYKTGKKSFDYCDVINGIGLQMLLYLFALEENGAHLVGEGAIPAGVQYFPARVPYLLLKNAPEEKAIAKGFKDELKRKGLILADEDVVQAMEPGDSPVRLSYGRSKEGSLTGDVACGRDFTTLKEYVFGLLEKTVDEIASGVVEPNPYYRDPFDNACKYCPYDKICHKESVEGYRFYKAISSAEFWDSIREELSDRG